MKASRFETASQGECTRRHPTYQHARRSCQPSSNLRSQRARRHPPHSVHQGPSWSPTSPRHSLAVCSSARAPSLWGSNSGALAAMLARLSMSASTMTLTRASIGSFVTEREFEQVLDLFKTLLPAEGRNKVRKICPSFPRRLLWLQLATLGATRRLSTCSALSTRFQLAGSRNCRERRTRMAGRWIWCCCSSSKRTRTSRS